MGNPGFPIPLRAGQAGSKRRAADAPSPHPPACGPGPPAGGSVGKPGFPTPRSESLCSRQGTFQRLLLQCKRRRETRQRHTCLLACLASLEGTLSYHTCARAQAEAGPGRAAPSQTLPRVGAWGNPVSPYPCGAEAWGNPVSPHPSSRAYVHVSPPCGSAAHRRDEHRLFLGGLRPSKPSRGRGRGETRFPHTLSSESLCSR